MKNTFWIKLNNLEHPNTNDNYQFLNESISEKENNNKSLNRVDILMMSKDSKLTRYRDLDSDRISENLKVSHYRKLSQPMDSELKVEDL